MRYAFLGMCIPYKVSRGEGYLREVMVHGRYRKEDRNSVIFSNKIYKIENASESTQKGNQKKNCSNSITHY